MNVGTIIETLKTEQKQRKIRGWGQPVGMAHNDPTWEETVVARLPNHLADRT